MSATHISIPELTTPRPRCYMSANLHVEASATLDMRVSNPLDSSRPYASLLIDEDGSTTSLRLFFAAPSKLRELAKLCDAAADELDATEPRWDA